MKLHTYIIPAELISTFRSLTIDEAVEQLTQDGFTATPNEAQKIIDRIMRATGFVTADAWKTYRCNQKLIVWDTDHPEYDEEDAMCEIVRELVETY